MSEIKVTEEMAKEAQRAYHRQWREKNRERLREYQKEYWTNKALRELQKAGEANE